MRIVTATRVNENDEWEKEEIEWAGTFAEYAESIKPAWDRFKDMSAKDYLQLQVKGGHFMIAEPANWETLL